MIDEELMAESRWIEEQNDDPKKHGRPRLPREVAYEAQRMAKRALDTVNEVRGAQEVVLDATADIQRVIDPLERDIAALRRRVRVGINKVTVVTEVSRYVLSTMPEERHAAWWDMLLLALDLDDGWWSGKYTLNGWAHRVLNVPEVEHAAGWRRATGQ